MEDDTRRTDALAIYRAGVRAADPRAVVRAAASAIDAPRIVIAALGKASIAMAVGARDALGERVSKSLVVTNEPATFPGLEVLRGDHPIPGAASVVAGHALLALASACGESDLFLALVSGGASALAEVPRPPLSIDELARTNALLLASGAPIAQTNVVRRHLSSLKGGRLARAARPARVVTLALSDVVGGSLADVGSGPTVYDATTRGDGWAVLVRHGLADAVPAGVRALLSSPTQQRERGEDESSFAHDHAAIVGDARMAAHGAAAKAAELGYRAIVVTTALQGDARDVAREVVSRARAARATVPVCLVLAGETTVAVRGSGKGGRDQTLALAAALALDGEEGITVAALATDGIDGPTDAAGAIVDGTTATRIRAGGCDPAAALADDDAFSALDAVGALVRTGPSGTNVNDLVVALVGKRRR